MRPGRRLGPRLALRHGGGRAPRLPRPPGPGLAPHPRPAAAAVAGVARRTAVLAAVAFLAAAAAGCGAGVTSPQGPDPTPRPTISPAVAATRVQLEGALRARGLTLEATEIFIRPGEPPSMAEVPRTALRAVLPDDPSGGLIVVYELPDASAAASRATELAAYVASGPGRVQYPPDARFVIRQVSATIVFFPWSAASSPDARTADVAAAVAAVGTEVPIPPG